MFGYPDETLSLVFDILLQQVVISKFSFVSTWKKKLFLLQSAVPDITDTPPEKVLEFPGLWGEGDGDGGFCNLTQTFKEMCAVYWNFGVGMYGYILELHNTKLSKIFLDEKQEHVSS